MFDHLNLGKTLSNSAPPLYVSCSVCSRLCVMYMGVIDGGGGEGLLGI